jgi:hypothetical protein
VDTLELLGVTVNGAIARRTWLGREWLVAPVTMIVPGVLNGSKGPMLYPEDEVSREPDKWNGVWLTAGHPRVNGQFVSARHPAVLEKYGLGQVFNARFEGGKLLGEAWFDPALVRRNAAQLHDRLLNGTATELSTGLFTHDEPVRNGRHTDGRPYDYVARNYRPDHLAILLGETGACSVKDGCGVLANESGAVDVTGLVGGEAPAPAADPPEDGPGLLRRFADVLVNAFGGQPRSAVTGRLKASNAGVGAGPVHEAAQAGHLAVLITDRHRDLGARAKADLGELGHNPPSWVEDEDTWQRAKAAADKADCTDYYACVTAIYEKMGGATANAFCPTGEGGGVDPTCPPGGGGRAAGTDEGKNAAFLAGVKDLEARGLAHSEKFIPRTTAGIGTTPTEQAAAAADASQRAFSPEERSMRARNTNIYEHMKLTGKDPWPDFTPDDLTRPGNWYSLEQHYKSLRGGARNAGTPAANADPDAGPAEPTLTANSSPENRMDRNAMIQYVTANCACKQATANELTDDQLRMLVNGHHFKRGQKVKVVVNGVPLATTLTVNEIPVGHETPECRPDMTPEQCAEAARAAKVGDAGKPQVAGNAAARPQTEEEWLAAAPPGVREQFAFSKQLVDNQKGVLVRGLVANLAADRRDAVAVELMAKGLPELEFMHSLIPAPAGNRQPPQTALPPSYYGAQGGAVVGNRARDDDDYKPSAEPLHEQSRSDWNEIRKDGLHTRQPAGAK